MTQKIKIAKIETREGDNAKGHWQSYIITGEDKSKVSTFDASASSLKEGDTIEAEVEVKGKFVNLTSFKVIDHNIPTLKSEPRQTVDGGNDRGQSIESQVAIKAIVELRIANALTDKSPEYQAMLLWCRRRLGIELAPELPPEAVESTGKPSKASTSAVISQEEKQPEKAGANNAVKELYDLVKKNKPACKSDKNVEAYLQGVLKIDLARLETEPDKVLAEVKTITGWK